MRGVGVGTKGRREGGAGISAAISTSLSIVEGRGTHEAVGTMGREVEAGSSSL